VQWQKADRSTKRQDTVAGIRRGIKDAGDVQPDPGESPCSGRKIIRACQMGTHCAQDPETQKGVGKFGEGGGKSESGYCLPATTTGGFCFCPSGFSYPFIHPTHLGTSCCNSSCVGSSLP